MNTQPEVTLTEPHSAIPEAIRAGIEAALSRPVLLDPRAVDAVRAAADFRLDMPDALRDARSEPQTYEREGPIAVVTIEGPLTQRAWSCLGEFGGDGYDAIQARVTAALADKQVAAVVMRIDSPGGEVAGCMEAVRAIRSAGRAAGKPIVAYADEVATSAAYAMACAADAIVLPDTGAVGSIGVILSVSDHSARFEKNGTKVHVISSGARKADGHPALPLSDEARATFQAEISYLADVFAREVASARPGLTPAAVLGLEAGIFFGPDAVATNLADQVGNFNDALALATDLSRRPRRSSNPIQGTKTMDTVIQALGLKPGASEAEVLSAVNLLKAERADLLRALDAPALSGALGAIEGLKTGSSRLKAVEVENDRLKAEIERRERDALIARGKAEGKLTPALIEFWASEPSEKLAGFLAKAPVNPILVDPPAREPRPGPPGGLTSPDGKTWEQMNAKERDALYRAHRETYEALKADAERRNGHA